MRVFSVWAGLSVKWRYTHVVDVQAVRHERHDRRKAHDLLDDTVHVRQVLFVVHIRQALRPNDTINFLLCTLLYLGVQSHHEEECPDGGHGLLGDTRGECERHGD